MADPSASDLRDTNFVSDISDPVYKRGLLDLLLGRKGRLVGATPRDYPASPSDADLELAHKSGVGYGLPGEAFYQGQVNRVVPADSPTTFATKTSPAGASNTYEAQPSYLAQREYLGALLRANRSPVAGVGLDPAQFNVDVVPGTNYTAAGAYSPKTDMGWVNAAQSSEANTPGATMSHEATHRGLEMMRKEFGEGVINKLLWQAYSGAFANQRYGLDESVTRRLNSQSAGVDESYKGQFPTPDEAMTRDKQYQRQESKDAKETLELMAQQMIARRRRGGPR